MQTTEPLEKLNTGYRGPAWYQEWYFRVALQRAMRAADATGTELSVIVLSLPAFSRSASHALFDLASGLERRFIFGLLGDGDFAIAMPGVGFEGAAAVRHTVLSQLDEHHPIVGFAVYDDEPTAEALIATASPAVRHAGWRLTA